MYLQGNIYYNYKSKKIIIPNKNNLSNIWGMPIMFIIFCINFRTINMTKLTLMKEKSCKKSYIKDIYFFKLHDS